MISEKSERCSEKQPKEDDFNDISRRADARVGFSQTKFISRKGKVVPMAGHYGYMPRREGEFLAWIRAIYDQCAIHSAIWQISDALLEQLEILLLAAGSVRTLHPGGVYRPEGHKPAYVACWNWQAEQREENNY
ncbi:MAG: hypothetical protein LBQ54_16140 [Planctomycetaceae bacterium]|nr:hypothetical protein [Planctomycetaceae bacterium]